jgi:hypothetical protein
MAPIRGRDAPRSLSCGRRYRRQKTLQRSTTRPARGCHPCLRDDPSPMSPSWTPKSAGGESASQRSLKDKAFSTLPDKTHRLSYGPRRQSAHEPGRGDCPPHRRRTPEPELLSRVSTSLSSAAIEGCGAGSPKPIVLTEGKILEKNRSILISGLSLGERAPPLLSGIQFLSATWKLEYLLCSRPFGKSVLARAKTKSRNIACPAADNHSFANGFASI